MPIILDGTAGLTNNATDLNYTGTLTGGTGVVNLGSGQVFKDASGNVGIGTSSPSSLGKLAVSGNVYLGDTTSTSDGTLTIGSAGAGSVAIGRTGTGATNSAITFSTTFSTLQERARIDSSGNLLVGTTSSTAPNAGFSVFTAGAGNTQAIIGHSTSSGSGQSYLALLYSGSTIGSIIQSGTTAVLYNTTSDYRLKTVLGPVANAGQRIDALQPVDYEWKSDGSQTRGFLAHQFQEVYAGSVNGTKDAVDEEGKPVYQSMQASSSEVIADLVAEIQSLRQRITALEAK